MKLKLFLLFFFASTQALAINTNGYEQIKEVKAWSTKIDVYLQSNQEHQCPGSLKTRFRADVEKEQHVSFLLAAFMAGKTVSLSYGCDSEGYPIISGVRVR